MNGLVILAAIAVSLAALLWLSFTDPKRRRAFARPPYAGSRRVGLAWSVALLPGPFLPGLAGGPGLVLWLGALTVIGWGLIAIPPTRQGMAATAFERWATGFGARIGALGRRLRASLSALRPSRTAGASGAAPATLAARVAALEEHVRRLEAELGQPRPGAPDRLPAETPDARVA